ncbi:penicillin epimerase [marine bacterium AO1-C]|nr:penicillin epimerase [marine bacterium AO1-C]
MLEKRRNFLKKMGQISLGASVMGFSPLVIENVEAAARHIAHLTPEAAAQEEGFWYQVQKAWVQSPHFINLENGYFSPQPTEVVEGQIKNVQMVNEMPSFYMRRRQNEDHQGIKQLLADLAGCSPEEIAITRNTTEALDTVIAGLDLKKGDEAIMTNQDYGNMLAAFDQQSRRFGVKNKIIELPLHPKSDQEILDLYEQQMTKRTKVILVTHLINISGQVLPAKKLADLAHSKGIEVIIDAAHSFAQLNFKIPELGGDYLGTSLHKWLCTPVGLGMMYIKKDKIKNVWPLFGDKSHKPDDIRKFDSIGTRPCSAVLTIANAIRFHQSIGAKRKEARLRYLKNYWVNKVKDLPKVTINTPFEDARSCAIANIAVKGKTPNELAEYFYKKHRIFTVAINNVAVKGVRITPHLYTTTRDLDKFVKAIEEIGK